MEQENSKIIENIEKPKNAKTWIKKDGTVMTKIYDNKKYNTKYYENPENLMKKTNKIKCECGGSYVLTNKSNHSKSKYHKLYDKLNEYKTKDFLTVSF
jgi:hypothetical protein